MSSTVYVQFAKPINGAMAKVKLLEVMDDYRNQQYIFNEIKPTLEEFAGKKVTKRLTTKLNKLFPNFNCYLRWIGSTQCYLEIKWTNEKYKFQTLGELSIFLGHLGYHSYRTVDNGRGYYTMEMIANNNVWLYQIDTMLKSMLEGIKIMDAEIVAWNESLEKMQQINEKMDKFHYMSTFFEVRS